MSSVVVLKELAREARVPTKLARRRLREQGIRRRRGTMRWEWERRERRRILRAISES